MKSTKTPLAPRLYNTAQLIEMGYVGSVRQLRRLIAAGRFPAPVYLSKKRPAWRPADLDKHERNLSTTKPASLTPTKSK